MATPQTTTELQRTVPTGANGVSVTPNGTTWTDSSWVEITSGLGSAITIVGVVVDPGIATDSFEIDIGTGTAGNEVVVASLVGNIETLAGYRGLYHEFFIPIENIATSTRITVRLRKEGTSTATWSFKLVYYNTVASTVGVTANPTLLAPPAALGVSVTPDASAWVDSSWVELSSSLSNIAILGVVFNASTGITDAVFEIDIGKGGAGAETVVATNAASVDTRAGTAYLLGFFVPVVVSGTNRISIRLRKSGTVTNTWQFKLLYISSSGFGSEQIQYTSSIVKTAPNVGPITALAGANSSWVNTAWLEMIASTSAAIVVLGVIHNRVLVDDGIEYEVGKGGAGSEVVVTGGGLHTLSALGMDSIIPQSIPVDNIPTATRVAIRFRQSIASATNFVPVLQYVEKPI